MMQVLKIAGEQTQALKNESDLSSFNFASLASTIKQNTMWRIDMELSNQIDRNGECYDATESGFDRYFS